MGTFRGVGDPTADGIRVASQDDLDAAVNAADQFAQDADASATASATSAQESEAALYEFDGIWLQSQASDPTTDLNGDPLTGNELYHNTVANDIRFYNLGDTTWYTFGVIGPGSSVDGGIPEWDGTGGNTLRDSGKTLATLIDEVGDVDGPVSASDGNLAVFDGTTGKLIKDGGPLGGGTGDVVGPSFSTANDIVTFDGTSGKLIKDSGTKLGDLGDVQGPVGSVVDGNLAVWDGTNGTEIKDGGPPSAGGGGETKNYFRNAMIETFQRGPQDELNISTDFEHIDGFQYFTNMGQFRVRIGASTSNLPPTAENRDVKHTHRLWVTATESGGPTSSDYAGVAQHIESGDVKDWMWGTSEAKDVTFSFWAHTNISGSFAFVIQNRDRNQSYVHKYTLSQFAWTKVEVTVPGNTDALWINSSPENDIGVSVNWMVQSGNDAGSLDTWLGANNLGASGTLDFAANNGAQFEFTKIKAEVGSEATDFSMKSTADDWQANARYYQTSRKRNEDISTNSATGQRYDYATNAGKYRDQVKFEVTMRAQPTITTRDPITITSNSIRYNNSTRTPIAATNLNEHSFAISYTSASTTNAPVEYQWDADAKMKTGN